MDPDFGTTAGILVIITAVLVTYHTQFERIFVLIECLDAMELISV